MKVRLNVPYEEKEAAKRLGARWDPKHKYWYVWKPSNVMTFSRWLKEELKGWSHATDAKCGLGKTKGKGKKGR